jgi:hypothetical protein
MKSLFRKLLEFFEDDKGRLSQKRLIAFIFCNFVGLLIFAYASHTHYEFTLGTLVGGIGTLLVTSTIEKYIPKENRDESKNPPL